MYNYFEEKILKDLSKSVASKNTVNIVPATAIIAVAGTIICVAPRFFDYLETALIDGHTRYKEQLEFDAEQKALKREHESAIKSMELEGSLKEIRESNIEKIKQLEKEICFQKEEAAKFKYWSDEARLELEKFKASQKNNQKGNGRNNP